MKILVLSTGGTIGSATKDGVMSPDKNATALLVLLYESSFQDVAEFDVRGVRKFFPKKSPGLFTKSL